MNQTPGQPAGRFDWYTLYTVWLSYPLEKEGGNGMNGLMTEREWRRQAARAKPPRSVCWGAQCVLPAKRRKKLREDRSFSVFLLLLSLSAALAMPVLTPRTLRQQ